MTVVGQWGGPCPVCNVDLSRFARGTADAVKATDKTLSATSPRNLSVRTIMSGVIAGIRTDAEPLAAVSIDLASHGQLLALVTRKAADELGIRDGDQVFALIKTEAPDERTVAASRS